MEHLYFPPSLRHLEPLRVIRPDPMAHVSFVYDLVHAKRPGLVVDVGTGAGLAMSIACQSMRDHDVGGLVYGIDPWEDDEAKPDDDPTRWAALNNFLHTYFRGVSYLMKMPCAQGLQHFAEASIDILRLDPGRIGAPLGPLLEAWLPRLAPGGVLLCLGVGNPERPDLAEDWSRATEGSGTFVFPHGAGLGVRCRAVGLRDASAPDAPEPPALMQMLTSEDPTDREGLARFYAHADRHHSIRAEVLDKRFDLHRKK